MLSPHLPAELQSQPQGCLVVLLLTLCIIIFRVFDVPPPPQSWKYFVGGVFPSLAFTLWVHVFPDLIHSVGCLLLSCSSPPLPAEHWQKRSRPLRALLLLPVLCELPGLGLARWEALLLFARLHSCNLSEPERGSSFSSISNLFRTKHCVVQSRRVY